MRSTKSHSWSERLCGTGAIQPPPHVFTLERARLRYGSFHPTPQGLVFELCRTQELPPGWMGDGVMGAPLGEPQVFAELVAALVADLGIHQASLVLPDTWLRLTFAEFATLPRKARERDEVLRWKLKRLVPFRIEDLRLAELEVRPFPTQEEPHRLLLGFAIEALLAQFEEAFANAGIELGQITNATLAILAGLEHTVPTDDLAALVTVQDDAFTIAYLYDGEPLLYRYKAFAEQTGEHSQAVAVRRDLRLTTSFVHQHFPAPPLRRCFLAARPEAEEVWLEWLSDEFEVMPEPLGFEHFPLARTQIDLTWLETAPLVGAACLEVSWP